MLIGIITTSGYGNIADLSGYELGVLLGISPTPEPDPRQALELIESTREHVLGALEAVVCDLPTNDTLVHAGITGWEHVQAIAGSEGDHLLAALGRAVCFHAPIGAAAVTSWRKLAHAALAYRDGTVRWKAVTDRADATVKLARWVYSGGYAHALGEG